MRGEKGKRMGIGGAARRRRGAGPVRAGSPAGDDRARAHRGRIVAWLAGLIVTVAVAATAGLLALLNRREVQVATPPAAEQAIDTPRRDIDDVKGRAGKR